MSQTVVLPSSSGTDLNKHMFPVPPPDCTPQQIQQLIAQAEIEGGHVPALLPAQEDLQLAPLLAPLASHHQQSDYNIYKFGRNGANANYYPLSLALPSHIQVLREKQAAFRDANGSDLFYGSSTRAVKRTREVAFPQDIRTPRSAEDETPLVPSVRTTVTSQVPPRIARHSSESSVPRPVESSPDRGRVQRISLASLAGQGRILPQLDPPGSVALSADLESALSSPLSVPQPNVSSSSVPSSSSPAETVHVGPKTSETHPINVAHIIPPELIPSLSYGLRYTSSPSFSPHAMSTVFTLTTEFSLPLLLSLGIGTTPSSAEPQAPSNGPTITIASNAMPSTPLVSLPPAVQPKQSSPPPSFPVRIPLVEVPSSSSSESTPVAQHISLPSSSPSLHFEHSSISPITVPSAAHTHASAPFPPPGLSSVPQTSPRPTPSPMFDSGPIPNGVQAPLIPSTPHSVGPPFMLGNMILSSCPGKKVRLSAPPQKLASTRSAINRDLATDLTRISSLGVSLIINCLSDDELAFLGSPWETYVETAHKLGIDVLRMPMPEGLAPLDPAETDRLMERVIREYTAKGKNVLAHCRGGVGRAGLIACCWMIKLGVCGSVAPAPFAQPGYVRYDTLALVQNAIKVVRARRSLKAIETYEQVKFLVDYVEYLRSTPFRHIVPSSTSPASHGRVQ